MMMTRNHDDNDESDLMATTKPPKSMTMLRMQSVLSSMILIGLGAIGGFGAFHFALNQRIQTTEETHNVTLAMVQNTFVTTKAERNKCFENENGRLQEISDLRGRLDAQYKSWYDLKASQKVLSASHQEATLEVQSWKSKFDQDQVALDELRSHLEEENRLLKNVQSELETDRLARVQLESEITSLRDLTQSQQTRLEQERKELNQRISQTSTDLQNLQRDSLVLSQEKERLEIDAEGMKERLQSMQLEIEEKDNELFEYHEEEGNLETKLVNFREGMLELLKEKIHEIQDLEQHIDNLHREKKELETKLDNWRDGMLALVQDKMKEVEDLKRELAESKVAMTNIMNEVDAARSDQGVAEISVQEKMDTIEESDPEDEETIRELKEEVERIRSELQESKEWVAKTMQEIEQGRLNQEESEKLITEKTNEIQNLNQKMKQDQESAKEMVSKLESDVRDAQTLLEEKTDQVERLNSELTEFVSEISRLKSGLTGTGVAAESTTSDIMIDHVQQRDGVMCRQLFGKGPYYVKFVIRLPSSESSEENLNFFVIELPSRKHLPHSTYTFLTLVESNLYNDGAAFLFANDSGLYIGSKNVSEGITLEQKLKPLGLTGGASLSFVETSTTGNNLPCGEYSFGFDHRGPGLNLFLSDDDDDDDDNNRSTTDCFAQVIRGQENLRDIQTLLIEREGPLEVVSVTHLRVD